MFIERRINNATQAVELWKCEWENLSGQPAKKLYIEKVCDEQPVKPNVEEAMSQASAICWSYGRTLGNIAVFSQSVLGKFPAKSGTNAILPCDFVNAGKFRHGADRWWCRTHQAHWGTKADYASYEQLGHLVCANHAQEMNYVVGPYQMNVDEFSEVGIWCSMPEALSSRPIQERPPKIHVHVRQEPEGRKIVDRDFEAIALLYSSKTKLFGNSDITQVNITPPAAFEFVSALELGREIGCVNCSHCGFPHLDLGDFAHTPHRKHFCANCGRDSTWSKTAIISTPLKPLHDQFHQASVFVDPARSVNLDDYKGYNYKIWASTPAILWTANRPQEKGIHVHVDDGAKRLIDDTFSEVILDGTRLLRSELIEMMMRRTIT
jgi:hypothetical protein